MAAGLFRAFKQAQLCFKSPGKLGMWCFLTYLTMQPQLLWRTLRNYILQNKEWEMLEETI
jgi:hypothetical protein